MGGWVARVMKLTYLTTLGPNPSYPIMGAVLMYLVNAQATTRAHSRHASHAAAVKITSRTLGVTEKTETFIKDALNAKSSRVQFPPIDTTKCKGVWGMGYGILTASSPSNVVQLEVK